MKPKTVVRSMVVPICGVDSVRLKHRVLKLPMKYVFLFYFPVPACLLFVDSKSWAAESGRAGEQPGIGRSKEPARRVAAPGWSRRGAARPWRPGKGPGTAEERRSRGARGSPCGGYSPAADAAHWQDQLQEAGDGVGRWRLWRLGRGAGVEEEPARRLRRRHRWAAQDVAADKVKEIGRAHV